LQIGCKGTNKRVKNQIYLRFSERLILANRPKKTEKRLNRWQNEEKTVNLPRFLYINQH